ncbi:hypothetical protein HK101_003421 [Irineochytrium annulatum]|nr:hypothetical protein HK101_003421 [Irineochytrium annulatum]
MGDTINKIKNAAHNAKEGIKDAFNGQKNHSSTTIDRTGNDANFGSNQGSYGGSEYGTSGVNTSGAGYTDQPHPTNTGSTGQNVMNKVKNAFTPNDSAANNSGLGTSGRDNGNAGFNNPSGTGYTDMPHNTNTGNTGLNVQNKIKNAFTPNDGTSGSGFNNNHGGSTDYPHPTNTGSTGQNVMNKVKNAFTPNDGTTGNTYGSGNDGLNSGTGHTSYSNSGNAGFTDQPHPTNTGSTGQNMMNKVKNAFTPNDASTNNSGFGTSGRDNGNAGFNNPSGTGYTDMPHNTNTGNTGLNVQNKIKNAFTPNDGTSGSGVNNNNGGFTDYPHPTNTGSTGQNVVNKVKNAFTPNDGGNNSGYNNNNSTFGSNNNSGKCFTDQPHPTNTGSTGQNVVNKVKNAFTGNGTSGVDNGNAGFHNPSGTGYTDMPHNTNTGNTGLNMQNKVKNAFTPNDGTSGSGFNNNSASNNNGGGGIMSEIKNDVKNAFSGNKGNGNTQAAGGMAGGSGY